MANLVEKYRATQRRLRALFAPYTTKLCPTCPNPCCRKPTKVREFDVLLAKASGCSLPSANRAAEEFLEASIRELAGSRAELPEPEPCDYLGDSGCMFPDDMRPYDCVRFVCARIKESMTPREIREVRQLLGRLSLHHRALLDATMPRRRK